MTDDDRTVRHGSTAVDVDGSLASLVHFPSIGFIYAAIRNSKLQEDMTCVQGGFCNRPCCLQ